MPSQLFKKFFQGHRSTRPNSECNGLAIDSGTQAPKRKNRFPNLSSTFHRPSRSQIQDPFVIESRLADLTPLPNVPQVAGTLRRDLARFKPLPEIGGDASDSSNSTQSQNLRQVIRRKPVPTAPPNIPPRTSSKRPDNPSIDASPHTRPAPEHDQRLPTSAQETSGIQDRVTVLPQLYPRHNSQKTSCFANISTFSSGRPSSSSPTVSLSDFPLPPGYESFDATIGNATTPLHVARAAVNNAPTAVDAQQCLLEYSEAYSREYSLGKLTIDTQHRRTSSGNTAPTIYTPPQRQEVLLDFEQACDALSQTVDGIRQERRSTQCMIRDGRRSCDMVRRLKDENCRLTAENKSVVNEQESLIMERRSLRKLLENLKTSLESAHKRRRLDEAEIKSLKGATLVNADAVNTAKGELSRAKADLQDERLDCARLRMEDITREKEAASLLARMNDCSGQVSLAMQAAENSKAAAKRSDDRNKQLDCAIAAKKYRIDQAAIVLENNQNFLIKTGHTAEQWYDRSMELTQMLNALGEEHKELEADLKQKLAQIGTLTELLEAGASELKKAQREAWTERHLQEEESRALAVSQKLHKESEQLRREAGSAVAELEKEIEVSQRLIAIEKRISSNLLGDAMLKNALLTKKHEHLQEQLSETPAQQHDLLEKVDKLTDQLWQAKQKISNQRRVVKTQAEDMAHNKRDAVALERMRKVLDCKVGRQALDLLELNNERDELKEELANAREDLRMTEENRDLWQRMAEKNLTELSLNEQCDQRDWALAQMREQLDLVDELKERNADMQRWGDDLLYEIGVHEHRLKEDKVMEIQYFRRFFSKMEDVFYEHREALVKLDSLEDRFAAQLEIEPLNLLREPDPQWSFEEEMGLDFVAQTVALYRGRDEDNESLGRQAERVQGVHGFGPAGAQVKPVPGMPEGCLERKAHRKAQEAQCGDVSEECF